MCTEIGSGLFQLAVKFLYIIFFSKANYLFKHLVGKIRKQFLRQTVGDVGLGVMRAVKQHIDPQNIFGNNNLMIGEPSKL